MKVIFFGTPEIGAKTLEYLLANQVNVVAVVTKPDRPKGRSGAPVPTPVKWVAQSQNPPIPLYQPEIVSDPAFAPTLAQYEADLFVVVAFGEIIKQHLLDMPKKGCINMHTSLLPKYRGAAPIQRAILAGEQETGVTIMHMVRKMDAGDMIKIVKVPIGPNMTAGELEDALCDSGKKALLEVIRAFANGTPSSIPQNHDEATLAPKIELEDCQIEWSKPAQEIHNLVRGANPHPGAWSFIAVRGQKKRVKIISTRFLADQQGSAGSILPSKKEFIVYCGKDALNILELQLEGKKAMSAAEFLRGISTDQLSFNC